MKDTRRQLDVFICGGSQHVGLLQPLLRALHPHGNVHLASSFLSDDDLRQLHGLYDVLHTPRHSPDGYANFELFSIRDVNRAATAPYFVKLDADVQLEPDWIDYIDECIAAHPDAVLFGPRKGNVDIDLELSGPLVRQLLGDDVRVRNAPKVIGGFYVGQTKFFRQHRRFTDIAHELLWCFKDGVRHRPSPNPEYWPRGRDGERITVVDRTGRFRSRGNEDTLRSLVVHAVRASDRLRVVDSGGRIRIFRSNGVMA